MARGAPHRNWIRLVHASSWGRMKYTHFRPQAAASRLMRLSYCTPLRRCQRSRLSSGTHLTCLKICLDILNMLIELAATTFPRVASGRIVRPLFNLFRLMYAQTALTTCPVDILFLPVILARSAESDRVAKIPVPLAFMRAAFFLPDATRPLALCPC